MKSALAIDVGSSSAKAVLGVLSKDGLEWAEVHRFEHRIIDDHGSLYWDLPTILSGVDEAVVAARDYLQVNYPGLNLGSVAVDSWGVDYVWVDQHNRPLGPPYSYRDQRGANSFESFTNRFSSKDLWQATGNQAEAITTCVQMFAELANNTETEMLDRGQDSLPRLSDHAARFLFLPDFLSVHLGGRAVAGAGIASTAGLANPDTTAWSEEVRNVLNIPPTVFPPLVGEGTVVGEVNNTKIIRAGSHDTACAVAALGEIASGTAFISAGSWSIAGMVTDHPVLSENARNAGLTNETCVDGRNRLLLNMTGLWLVQESRRQWAREGMDISFSELTNLAEQAESLGVVIDPNDPCLSQPGNIPAELARLTRQRYGIEPQGVGQTVRLILESLAVAHARVFRQLSELTGNHPEVIRMVGGGIQDRLLCQYTADACKLPVIAGPVEASALGSLITQFATLGEDVKHVLDGETKTYEPRTGIWDSLSSRYEETAQ